MARKSKKHSRINAFRSKLKSIRWSSPQALLVIALVVIGGGYLVYNAFATTPAHYYQLHNDEVYHFNHINLAREAVGKADLTLSYCLEKVARDDAYYMATHQLVRDPTGTEMNTFCPNWYGTFAGNAGVTANCNYQGNDGCSGTLFTAFMNSPEHKANILGGYTYVGTGSYRDSNGYLWVAHAFATSGCSSCNATNYDSRSFMGSSSPAAGSTVVAGQLLTLTARVNNIRSGVQTSTALEAYIPNGTTYVSMSTGSNDPYTTSHGMNNGATPQYPGGAYHAYWLFSKLPANGTSYNDVTETYTVRVNSGLPSGYKICPHDSFRSAQQGTYSAGMTCFTVK